MQRIADATDIDFRVETDLRNADGKKVNGAFTYENGRATITIDVNAMNDTRSILSFTLAHELTHFIHDWSPAKYDAFARFLIENYEEAGYGENAEAIIRERMERGYSRALATEELVAEACQRFLVDGNAFDMIGKLAAQDRTLAEKIRDGIKAFADKLRAAFKGARAQGMESAMTQTLKTLDRLHQMWTQALEDAALNYRAASPETVAKVAKGEARYSIAEAKDGRPVVVVNDDITKYASNEKDLLNLVKEAVTKFEIVPIKKQTIFFTKGDTAKEVVYSKYSSWLKRKNPQVFFDKLRLLSHPQDIIYATTDYINEAPKHARTDDIIDFARGKMLMDIGGRKYSADVVIGFTEGGICELHDIVNINATAFEYKERSAATPSRQKTTGETAVTPSADSITERNQVVNSKTENSGEKISAADDARYLDLAKDPEANRDELQRMVAEAAKRTGYTHECRSRKENENTSCG